MNDVFPLYKFPFLRRYDQDCFVYGLGNGSFREALVKARLQYRPAAYMVHDYSHNLLGENKYVGASGTNGDAVCEQQVPVRLLTASCDLPEGYPACGGKRTNIKRGSFWPHMMQCDGLSALIFFIFYPDFVVKDKQLTCRPTPFELEDQIVRTCEELRLPHSRWSCKRT